MKHALDRLLAALALRDRRIDASSLQQAYESFLRGEKPSVLQALASLQFLRDEDRPDLERATSGELVFAAMRIIEECDAPLVAELFQRDPHLQDVWLVHPSAPAHPRHQLVKVHGEGGLGCVWLAQDAALGRTVALKELKADAARHSAARQRFLREARITGALQHPFIVPVYELHAGNSPYYTMRLVHGVTLADAIARHHEGAADWPLDRLLGVFDDVCQAVAFAHASGIVHRDLKPANVAVGNFGEVFVLDWGLARNLGDSADEENSPSSDGESSENVTRAGQILGTPAYMSPEQAGGGSHPIERPSDIYSLGAILFHILANRTPHSAGESEPEAAYLQRIREGRIARLTGVARNSPPELDAVCGHAMALRPEQRYATVQELAADVQRWRNGEPVSVYREPWPRRLGRWAVRHRRTTLLAAAALIALAVTLAAFAVAASKDAAMVRSFAAKNVENRGVELRAAIIAEMASASHDARAEALMSGVREVVTTGGTDVAARERLVRDWQTRLKQRPIYLAFAIVDAAADWNPLLRVEREHVHLASSNEPCSRSLKALLKAHPPRHAALYLAKLGDEPTRPTSLIALAPIEFADHEYWLACEINFDAFLKLILPSQHEVLVQAFVEDSLSGPIAAFGKDAADSSLASADWRSAHPRLAQFLVANPAKTERNQLLLESHRLQPPDPEMVFTQSSDAGVLYAVKVYYNADRPEHCLYVILALPVHDALAQTAASQDLFVALAAVVFLALAGMMLLARLMPGTRAPVTVRS